jgi:phage tail-like protein
MGQRMERSGLAVSHTADFSRRYRGERVTFYTRVDVLHPVSGYTINIGLPEGLILGSYQPALESSGAPPRLVKDSAGVHVLWCESGPLETGASFEYQISARVAHVAEEGYLQSEAVVRRETDTGNEQDDGDASKGVARETACVYVRTKAQYLKHLPALYEEDELMGQLLTLFESFLNPIERTIDQIPFYFDPQTAPLDLLPWLASWFNLVLDERWPEAKRRRLLCSAVPLYRRRGTCRGLREYLEIYTGEVPQIIEHRARNLVLGRDARLGPGIALGTQNVPHTFTVTLHLPPIEGGDDGDVALQEDERRRVIERIIEAEKPAHTAYNLQIESVG